MLSRPLSRVRRHLGAHARFYGAAAVGVFVWAAAGELDPALRLLLAGDAFFLCHLLAVLSLASSHRAFQERARVGDDGLPLIFALTVAAVGLSLSAAFILLNHAEHHGALRIAVPLASVLLAWLMLHAVAAFHYAHAFYGDRGGRRPPRGGLAFPGGAEPGASEFFYYAFVVGMTAQVSDVSVLTPAMRRLTLAHGIASFFFNTVILAITVNAVLTLAR